MWRTDRSFPPSSQLVAGTISRLVLIDLSGHFSRSVIKSPNFYCSTSTQKHRLVRKCLIWKCDGLFLPPWHQVVAGTNVRFVLIDLSGHFSRSMSIASFLLQCLHTNKPTGQKECLICKCILLLFPIELSELTILFICLYSLTFAVIFQGQWLIRLISTAVSPQRKCA